MACVIGSPMKTSGQPSPRLRRENRIHTIQASLAIGQYSLSIEQVTALTDVNQVDGRRQSG